MACRGATPAARYFGGRAGDAAFCNVVRRRCGCDGDLAPVRAPDETHTVVTFSVPVVSFPAPVAASVFVVQRVLRTPQGGQMWCPFGPPARRTSLSSREEWGHVAP